MERELKMKFIDPEEPIHEGLHYRKWVSKEEALKDFPDQPERSKREESHKLIYREPNLETMSDEMKAKYEKAKAICGALNIVETQ